MIFNQRIGGAGGASASILAYGDALQSTDTVYAEKDGKRINGVWKSQQEPNPDWHGLPAEYQQVEYLESTGVQWIDTGVVASSQITAEIKFALISATGLDTKIFGMYDGVGGETWLLGTCDGKYRLIPYGIGWESIDVLTNVAVHNAIMNDENGRYIFDGYTYYKMTNEWSSSRTCWAFSSNNDNKPASCKIYKIRIISRSTTDTLNIFIPCYRKSDHKPGLYDTVNDVFYVNQGAGADFLVGASVPQYKTGFEIAPIREYGTWVLTATHGASTKTINVLVDAAEEFAVEVTA